MATASSTRRRRRTADDAADDETAERRGAQFSFSDRFREIADTVTHAAGTPWAMGAAALVIVVWLVTGPIFGFSDTWQLIINTGTTIVTFLMVFAIQTSQNREAKAMHLKLDELIRATKGARNAFIDEEHETEAALKIDEARLKRARRCGR
jgi:low affinity Fe/Cu permease